MKRKVFQHVNPIWVDRADFIINSIVPPPSENDESIYWEQFWSRQIDELKFEICCIPFYVYDLALGDIVETDKRHMISQVIKRSGYFTIRIWFFEIDEETRFIIEKTIYSYGCLMEFYNERLLGVSSDSEKIKRKLIKGLNAFEKKGWIDYEIGLF